MSEHRHAWTPWERTGAMFAYNGAYLGPTRIQLSGGDPITPGDWHRACPACGAIERRP